MGVGLTLQLGWWISDKVGSAGGSQGVVDNKLSSKAMGVRLDLGLYSRSQVSFYVPNYNGGWTYAGVRLMDSDKVGSAGGSQGVVDNKLS